MKPRRRQRGTTGLPFYACPTAAMPASRLEMPFRRVHARLAAGALTGGAPSSSRRGVMYRAAEDGLALLEAAQQLHAERHGPKTFLPGTRLSFLEAAKRAGIRSDRQRYYDAIEDLEYEGAIEWDESARYARGDKHYLITRRGGHDLGSAGTEAIHEGQRKLFEG